MKRALQLREYRNVQTFEAPEGVITVDIDPQSGMLATPNCPTMRQEVYIAGTQPVASCPLHGDGRQIVTSVSGWQTNPPAANVPAPDGGFRPAAPPNAAGPAGSRNPTARPQSPQTAQQQPPPDQKEKKGFFHRLWGVFK
jgi:hypothetical protein